MNIEFCIIHEHIKMFCFIQLTEQVQVYVHEFELRFILVWDELWG